MSAGCTGACERVVEALGRSERMSECLTMIKAITGLLSEPIDLALWLYTFVHRTVVHLF